MSYYPNQRGPDPDSGLPAINQKRFEDIIDYSQPRPQSGYDSRYSGHDADHQDGGYGQGYGRNQYDQGRSQGGYDQGQNASGYGSAKGYNSTGLSEPGASSAPLEFDVSEGQPIQLITANPRTGQFTLNEEAAAELIAAYEGNISFVTIAGKFRTGKSFLLNKVLSLREDGFGVDPTVESSTQGIWIWSKPVYSERDNLHIFFLDTEGSNNVDKSATHDAKIFALAMLMSSYFIYNSTGAISENSINDLSLVTQLSRNVVVSQEENSEHALSYYTPKLLWALRDFNLELKDPQGKTISSNQYMESILTDPAVLSKSSETNRKIRQTFLNYFKDRECLTFPIPIPGANDRDLKKINTLPNQQLKPEFLKAVNSLREKIVGKSSPKQLKGVNLNMRMYMSMVSKFIDELNHGSVPNISTAWAHMIENECREAYEQSVDLFEIALKQFFFNEESAKSIEDLYNILKNIRDSALEKYNKITAPFERSDLAQDFKNELKDYIDKKEQQVVGINEELNQTHNEELLQSLSQDIRHKIDANHYTPSNIQEYHDDFNGLLDTYDKEAQGLTKTTTLINFLTIFQPQMVSSLMLSLNKSFQGNQKNFEQEKLRLEENERNLKRNLEALRDKEKAAADEAARVKAEKAELANKAAKLADEVKKLKEGEELKLEEERKKLRAEANKVKEKEKEVAELSKQNKDLLDQINKRKNACCNMF